MKTKIEMQNDLIDAIIFEWHQKGFPLGYSKAQELINEYERQIKLLTNADVNVPVCECKNNFANYINQYNEKICYNCLGKIKSN